jgi:hypothetical protein
VAGQAEGAEIIEIALAPTFGYGPDMVRVPKGTSSGDALDAPHGERLRAGEATAAPQGCIGHHRVGGAQRADATVPGEHPIAEVAGVGAQTPLVNAIVRAESPAARGEDFEPTPAAERAAVRTQLGRLWRASSAGECESGGGLQACWDTSLLRSEARVGSWHQDKASDAP